MPSVSKLKDEIKVGDKFGHLTVLGDAFRVKLYVSSVVQWVCVCECDCGGIIVPHIWHLLKGETVACGGRCKVHKKGPRGHGMTRTAIYGVWCKIKDRCYNKKIRSYADYGERGITVCDVWRDRPDAFLAWAKQNGYRPGLEIDRIDNDGPYSPDNCRFVTHAQNARNRRSNVRVTAFGETKIAIEWAEDARCAVSYSTLRERFRKGRWDAELAITTPVRFK